MNTHRITSHETIAASRGFSLIELILVIFLIAAMAGIAFPVFKSITPVYQLRRAARELFINFKKAKIEAIKQHRTILIKLSANSYQICVASDTTNDCDPAASSQTIFLPKNVQLQNLNFQASDEDAKSITGFGNDGLVWSDGTYTHTGTVNIALADGSRSYLLSMPYKSGGLTLSSGS